MDIKLLATASIFVISSCALEQQPAPYVNKGDRSFNKYSSGNSYSLAGSSHPQEEDFSEYRDVSGAEAVDYIDSPNNSDPVIRSRPLTPLNSANDQRVPVGGKVNYGSGYSSRPIDADEREYSSVQNDAYQPNNYSDDSRFNSDAAPAPRPKPSYSRAEYAPPPVIENNGYRQESQQAATPSNSPNKEGYLDISKVDSFHPQQPKFSDVRPVAKPYYEAHTEAPVEAPSAPREVEERQVEQNPAPAEVAESVEIPSMPEMPEATRVEEVESSAGQENQSYSEPKEVEVASVEIPAAPPAPVKVQAAEEIVPQASAEKLLMPVDGAVIQEFGDKSDGTFNDGINIQASEGTPVKAANSGSVVYSGNQLQGYGNLVIIRHDNGYLTAYAHLESLELEKGATVKRGDIVGHVGRTGNVDQPQLHFGVRKGREPVNPRDFL